MVVSFCLYCFTALLFIFEISSTAPMLQIQVASDLHIEFYDDNDWDTKALIVPSCDVLALLGDIGVATSPEKFSQYVSFLSWCCRKFVHVLVLTGNHEYYNIAPTSTTIEEVDDAIERLQEILPQLIFMNKKSVLIEGVRILGTTLWSAIPNAIAGSEVENFLNDYRLIFQQNTGSKVKRRLTAEDSHKMHTEQLQWLTAALQEAELVSAVPVVVLSHHTPSLIGTSRPCYETTPLPLGYRNCGFSSPLDHIFTDFPSIRYWCFGHTHYNSNQVRGNGTILLSNQRGYQGAVAADYKRDLIIHIPSQYYDSSNNST